MSSEVHGPIDAVLVEFKGRELKGKTADALLDLIDRGIVRVYDLVVVRKDEDGTFSGVALDQSMAGDLGTFVEFEGAHSGLIGDDEIEDAAGAMEPGTVAALIVYENTWAIPFVAAARDAGGEMIASMRIPAADVMAALDALENA